MRRHGRAKDNVFLGVPTLQLACKGSCKKKGKGNLLREPNRHKYLLERQVPRIQGLFYASTLFFLSDHRPMLSFFFCISIVVILYTAPSH